MSKLIKRDQSAITKTNDKTLVETIDAKESFLIKKTIRLNLLGYLSFLMLNLIILSQVTAKFSKENKTSKDALEQKIVILQETLEKLKLSTQTESYRMKRDNSNELIAEIKALRNVILKQPSTANKHPSKHSVFNQTHTPRKTIAFSEKNLSILRYKQKLSYERYKRKLKNIEKKKVAGLDLRNPEQREKFEQIKDETKIKLYELSEQQYQERQEFQKNQYIVSN